MMGFPESDCINALLATNNGDIEVVTEWLMTRMEESGK
jgi:uncharacterized UBP type Zn finger protein